MGKLALAVIASFAAPLAFAQSASDGVAKLKDVHGNVLVSKAAGLASGGEALRLTKGTRVITTANADVVVVYDDGCEVHLKENQRFEVDTDRPCAVLISQVQSILVEPAAGVASTGAFTGVGVLLPALGGTAIGIEILQGIRHGQKASPS